MDLLGTSLKVSTQPGQLQIHHSDQSTQYTSIQFGKRCRQLRVKPSTGSAGDAYDNAMAESFFATLETELLWRSTFRSHAEARTAIFEFIEGFYNPHRRPSAIGNLSPVQFEQEHAPCPRRWKLTWPPLYCYEYPNSK